VKLDLLLLKLANFTLKPIWHVFGDSCYFSFRGCLDVHDADFELSYLSGELDDLLRHAVLLKRAHRLLLAIKTLLKCRRVV